jgi:hypothetical protein
MNDQPRRPYFTDHALNRMVQLGISQEAVAVTLEYGRAYRKDADAIVFIIDDIVLRQRAEMVGTLKKFKDLTVICSLASKPNNVVIVTVYRKDRSRERRCA